MLCPQSMERMYLGGAANHKERDINVAAHKILQKQKHNYQKQKTKDISTARLVVTGLPKRNKTQQKQKKQK